MTHYSENPGMVRVDYFKPGGKWYMTEAHDMYDYWDSPKRLGLTLHEAIEEMLRRDDAWRPHFTIVILQPYHVNSHPVMIPATAVME